MTIAKIESWADANVCFVRVTTDDGAEGWGQTAPFCADLTAQVLHRQVARLCLGRDALDVEALSDRVIEGCYKFPWSYVCRALAGVDTALWDLRGKLEGKSVCELLGGTPRPFPVYGSSMSREIKPADEAARVTRLRDERGFGAFKLRVGSVCGHDQDQWPGRTEDLVSTVRAAVGPDVKLLVDANSCYTPARAIEVGRMLEAHGVCHFEEPCPYWELEWTAEVAAALDVDITGGEQDNDLAQWRRMIRMGAIDVVQPDLCYVGGMTRALRVAAMAADTGRQCVPHSANVSWVTVFALHLLGAVPNAGDYCEFSIEGRGWAGELSDPALEVIDGKVQIPDGPGWGCTVRESWLERAAYAATKAR